MPFIKLNSSKVFAILSSSVIFFMLGDPWHECGRQSSHKREKTNAGGSRDALPLRAERGPGPSRLHLIASCGLGGFCSWKGSERPGRPLS